MDKLRTVSDTKREFYNYHTRPINSIYRRVVEELMVEMHLLSVNVDFEYDPIYALGVVTSFERFLQGYRPETDKESIFSALCQSVGGNSQGYRQDAEKLVTFAQSLSGQQFLDWFTSPTSVEGGESLFATVEKISKNPKFKYSRLFAIGLYTLLEKADANLVKNEEERAAAIKQLTDTLNLSGDKIQKDLDLYRSNLEKISQLLTVLDDAMKADRKKKSSNGNNKEE